MTKRLKNKVKAKGHGQDRPGLREWHRPALILFACLAFIILLLVIFQPEDKIVFKFSENLGIWQVSAGARLEPRGETVNLSGSGPDFYFFIPGLNLDADRYNTALLEMSQPLGYNQGRLFFLSPYNQDYNPHFSYYFDSGRAGRFNKTWINLEKNRAWQGIVRGILVLPGSERVSLKSLKFIRANLGTRIRAWWSDFTYYYEPKLGTCFGMASPFFISNSFNALLVPYLWLLLFFAVLAAAGTALLKLDQKIRRVIVAGFFLILAFFWLLLDCRNNAFYIKSINRNRSLYWGRDLEQKREIVVGDPEFVRFMKFCDTNIPLDAKIVNCVAKETPGVAYNYLAAIQTNFILRPRFKTYDNSSGKPVWNYYIFYKSTPAGIEGLEGKKLKMFKRFSENAFIMTD